MSGVTPRDGANRASDELWAALNIAGLDGDLPDDITAARVASAHRAALDAAEARVVPANHCLVHDVTYGSICAGCGAEAALRRVLQVCDDVEAVHEHNARQFGIGGSRVLVSLDEIRAAVKGSEG